MSPARHPSTIRNAKPDRVTVNSILHKQLMRKQIIEIPVQVLHKGLYVSRLDRPWIESPFLFQGFEIESDEQLSQLKELCKSVFIELTEEEADDLLSRTKRKDKPAAKNELAALDELSANINARVSLVPAKDPIPLKTELATAKTVYRDALASVTKLFDRLRRDGGLDVQLVESIVDSMVQSIFRNRDAMSWLARLKSKDDYLYNHSLAVSVWALAFGRHLGLDKETLRSIGMGAMVLDIGKTQLPLTLLRKADKPSESEWIELHGHVELGMAILDEDKTATACMKTMVAMHHERLDGSGYPHGLKGDSIPLAGRIAGIVDCYDAMISDRVYAKGLSTYDAVRELKRLGKSWFQPELVELFIQAVGVFPTGTLIELNTGEVGVVIAQNRFRRLRPQVMLVLDAQKKMRPEFSLIDLQLFVKANDSGNSELWITQGLEPGAYGIDPAEFFL
jgi:HD-GYP domain-containing protein (c-di-GMP phosphodiesterase class II)